MQRSTSSKEDMKLLKGRSSGTGQRVRTADFPVTRQTTDLKKAITILVQSGESPDRIAELVLQTLVNFDASEMPRFAQGEWSRRNIEAFVADALGETFNRAKGEQT